MRNTVEMLKIWLFTTLCMWTVTLGMTYLNYLDTPRVSYLQAVKTALNEYENYFYCVQFPVFFLGAISIYATWPFWLRILPILKKIQNYKGWVKFFSFISLLALAMTILFLVLSIIVLLYIVIWKPSDDFYFNVILAVISTKLIYLSCILSNSFLSDLKAFKSR